MPRLFTGILLPELVSDELDRLKSGLKNVHWQHPENHHLTLRFAGDITSLQADAFCEALDEIKMTPFDMTLSGVGVFGTRSVSTIWAGVALSNSLKSLQNQHERAALHAGLEPSHRKYMPHVTLARPRNLRFSAVAPYLESSNGFVSTTFKVDRFVVMSARDGVGGGPYVVEAEFMLEGSSVLPTIGESDNLAEL